MAISNTEVKSIGKHTLVYATGILLGKLASFIMLPIYTRHLTTADYGTLELLGTTLDLIGMIAGIGLASGVFKFYAQFDEQAEKNRVISTVALGTMGLAAATAAGGFILAPVLTDKILGSDVTPLYFRLFFLTYFLQSTIGIPFMLIRAHNRSALYVLLNLLKLVAQLALNIVFVVHLQWGVTGVLLANVIVVFALSLYMTHYVFSRVGFDFSVPLFRKMSRFGAPLILWSIGGFVLAFSDRYFLKHFHDIAAVGIYSLAYKFAFLLATVTVTPFQQVWGPRRYEIAKRPNADAVFSRVFLYLNISILGGAILIVLFIQDVLRVMVGPAFWGAYPIIPILLLSTLLQQWTGFCNFGLYYRDATHVSGWAAGVGVAAALGLNALLIPPFGAAGAAWATLGAYSTRFVVIYFAAQQRFHIDYPWAKTGVLVLLFVAARLLRLPLDGTPIAVSLAGSTLLMVLFTGTIYAIVLTAEERRTVRHAVRIVPRSVMRTAWQRVRSTRLFRPAQT